MFPSFSGFGVAGYYFVLKNPLADNPLWVRIWVRVVLAGFAEI